MKKTLIERVELGSAASSITFSSIPQTYDGLYCVFSLRAGGTDTSWVFYVRPNGATANLTHRLLQGDGSSVASASQTSIQPVTEPYNATANTFSNGSLLIPNYTSSSYKSVSVDSVAETNATSAYQRIGAGLWSDTSAITSLELVAPVEFVQYSSASLYGVTAGSDGTTTVS